MRRLVAIFSLFFALFSVPASSLDLNSAYYAVYEFEYDGVVQIYIVPKPSVLILASEPVTPITFMPQFPGYYLTLEADGRISSITQVPYTSKDVEAWGYVVPSGYKLLSGDFDGDSRSDFLLQGKAGRSSFIVATDSGTGGAYVYYDFKNSLDSNSVALSISDVDGNGRSDVIANGGAATYLSSSYGAWFDASDRLAGLSINYVGASAGKFRVDEQGEANYGIDIVTAPGSAGVTPHISLNYSSGGGSGIAGQGWSLGGLSAISRCRQTLAQDGRPRGITMTGEDRFCLDGQRLILDRDNTGSYGGNGATYRTEIDSYAVVTSHGGTVGNPAYFSVKRKDGSISYYGNGNGSTQVLAGTSNIMTWAISSFQDSVGNPIRFTYIDGNAGHRIDRIDYAYGVTSIPTYSSPTYIKFDYEQRPDPSNAYYAGSAISNTQRLAAIHSYGNGTELRTYNLIYQNPTASNFISTLTKLFECVGTSCISPTQFSWSVPKPGVDASNYSMNISNSEPLGLRFADFNGDGKEDLLYLVKSGASWTIRYQLSTGSGWSAVGTIGYVTDRKASIGILDINNDGKQDVMYGRAGENWNLALGSASGPMPASTPSVAFPYAKDAQFVDIDSDGLVDIVYPVGAYWHYRTLKRSEEYGSYVYSFGADVTPSYTTIYYGYEYSSNARPPTKQVVADFNGDGRMDLSTVGGPCEDAYCSTQWNAALIAGDNGSFREGAFLGYLYQDVIPVDLNGDGFTDLIRGNYDAAAGNWEYVINNKNGVSIDSQATVIGTFPSNRFTLADYNLDGYPDLIYPSGKNGTLRVRYFQPISLTFAAAIDTGIAVGDPAYEQYQFTDVDGDGHSDLIRTTFNGSSNTVVNLYKSKDAGKVTQRITRIDNGLGNITDIAYKPLTDPTVYTRANDANLVAWPHPNALTKQFPVYDIFAPSYVVSSVSSTAPAANDVSPGVVDFSAKSSVQYQYAGLKAQAAGRGMLGFGSITTTDPQSKVVTTTTYRQDYPFVGQPLTTTVKTAADHSIANRLLKQSTNEVWTTWQSKQTGDPVYHQVFPLKVTETTYDLATGNELSHTVADTGAPDDRGNVVFTRTRTFASNDHLSAISSITTNNTYGSTTFDKQFGRLSRTVVTHDRRYTDGSTNTKTRTSAFTYYPSGAQQGLLYQEIIEPDDAALKITTEYTYDSFGNKNRITKKAAGMADRYTAIAYDSAGRYPTSTSSPFCTAYTGSTSNCSAWADRVTENVVSRNAFGQPTQVNGLNGAISYIEYDALGREKRRYDNAGSGGGIGAEVTTTYSRGGQVAGAQYQVRTQTNTGGVSTDSFDALGRSIAKTAVGFGGQTVISKTEYDKLGRIKRQSQPAFEGYSTYWTTNTYDTLGRLIAQTAPATGGDIASSSTQYSVVSLTNGLNAGQTILTNALGQTRTEMRNPMGELIQVNDHLGGMVGYGYDALGQLVRTSNLGSGATILTDLEYDQLGRKIKMTDANKGTWFYKYNAFGELTDQYKVTSSTIYTGSLSNALLSNSGVTLQRTYMDYDLRGRMIVRSDKRENGAEEGSATWLYDTAPNGVGQLKSESGGGLTRSYSYDNLGRANGTTHADDSGTYMLTVSYDNYGRPLTQTDLLGTGSGTRNSYNGYGYLQSVTDLASNTVLYQAQNANQFGNTTSALLGNGGTSTWAYDDGTGHLLNQKAVVGLYNLVDLSYTWDKLGNQTSRQDKGLVAGTSNYRNLQQSFCYDGLNRLIKTANTAYSSSYCASVTSADQDQRYDAFGNITWKTGIGGYTYGDAAKPHTLTSTSGGSVMAATNYTYDKTGNMTSDTSGRALTYSVFDKPTLISKGSDSVSFAYGPDRNYYKRTDVKAGVTTRTHHIGGVEKVIKSDNSYDIKRYIAGVAIWTHKFSSAGAQTALDKQYTYKDVLGSTVLITDAIGGIKGQMAFDEWGKRVSYGDWRTDQSATYGALQVAALFTTQGYTGHDMLDAVGLIHMQGRIYDARLGRFVQADPIVQDVTDLQAYNRYAYVRNNPLTLVDPSGFSWWGKHVGKHWKKVWNEVKPYIQQIVTAVVAFYCIPCAAALNAAWTVANGGTLMQGLLAGASTLAFGYMPGGGTFSSLTASQIATNIVVGGLVGGVMSSLQGGSFGNGFISAGVGAAVGMGGFKTPGAQFAAATIAGGTASVMTGGKFANGAVSGAIGYATGYLAGKIRAGIDRLGADLSAPQYLKPQSPTSQDVENPTAVDFVSDEGAWGQVHWTGEASGVAQLQKDLKELAGASAMADVLSARQAAGGILNIRANLTEMNSGWNNVIQIDVAHEVILQTTKGPQAAPSIIKLGHELPHAILGTKDDGVMNMNNVNRYENPLRRELGYPERTKY